MLRRTRGLDLVRSRSESFELVRVWHTLNVLYNMGKRDQIYSELPDNDPKVGKPDPDFVRRLFGARIVGALDSTLDDKFKILDGSEDGKYRDLAEILETLSGEQRGTVQTLLKDTGKRLKN